MANVRKKTLKEIEAQAYTRGRLDGEELAIIAYATKANQIRKILEGLRTSTVTHVKQQLLEALEAWNPRG